MDNTSATGYGKNNPVADNSTAVGKAKNRRVQLVVSGDAIGLHQAAPSAGGDAPLPQGNLQPPVSKQKTPAPLRTHDKADRSLVGFVLARRTFRYFSV